MDKELLYKAERLNKSIEEIIMIQYMIGRIVSIEITGYDEMMCINKYFTHKVNMIDDVLSGRMVQLLKDRLIELEQELASL